LKNEKLRDTDEHDATTVSQITDD